MSHPRRHFLKSLGALSLAALSQPARPAHPSAAKAGDFCAPDATRPLFVPSDSGFLGRLEIGDEPIVLRAAPLGVQIKRKGPEFTQGYMVRHRGQDYRNPTLVLQTGRRVRVDFQNEIDQPTIVHWHGICVDAKNDGNGMSVAKPGSRFAYDFEVRDRSSLYWYHPHPHGTAAGQTYSGLFGMMVVEDPDDHALRSALDLRHGATEIPLVLHDRVAGGYRVHHHHRIHGFLGDTVLINGTACPYLDVATRIYRFRVLNASNARTYRLGFRTADGKTVPFLLAGGDAGLLAAPRPCTEVFISSGGRLDLLVDLSDMTVGDNVMLETRAFDPMHFEMRHADADNTIGDRVVLASAATGPHTATDASAGRGAAAHDHGTMDHSTMGHGDDEHSAAHLASEEQVAPSTSHAATHHDSRFPEGAARSLLQLRVRRRDVHRAAVPATLCKVAPIDISNAQERVLRLGFAKGRWRINDRVFVMGETPIEVKRDTVETWLIRNPANGMPHAMHVHGFHFQVLERQGSPAQLAKLAIDVRKRLATDDGWKDTVLVWPGEDVRLAIDFRMSFDGEQIYMVHCHNLEHEDGGMMLAFKVI